RASPKAAEDAGIEAMAEGRYLDAAEAFAAYIKIRPESFVGYYNLSAAMSRAGELDASQIAMTKALELGFTDRKQLMRDGDLAALRETEFFRSVMDAWDELIETRRKVDLQTVSQLITLKKQLRTSDDHRVELVSAHGEVATDQSLAEMDLLAQWAAENLFAAQADPAFLEGLPWVMVVLPDKTGFARWAVTVFGPGVRGSISSVGGAYEHQDRRLVAQDLGATFRHEFLHVLHWRDMNDRGQAHAPWVQEGLASLVEDYDMGDDRLVPVASWRTNIVKRLRDVRRLTPIEELAHTEMEQFTSSRPLAKYAQARAVMLFLLDHGRLGAFYNEYTKGISEDPSGVLALKRAMGMELDQIEEAYEAWIDALPAVPETGSDLSATLGIGITTGEGDGVVVESLTSAARRRTGLHTGEVITAINGRPTRDLFEFIRVLGSYSAGQSVTLTTRRGIKFSEVQVELLER
ncbi:MAG: PDZ domain-containing protein, partial [Phycisphaerales bacterium]|nr:PDZ domain-containing protein [Phycisphaerales bacterium]